MNKTGKKNILPSWSLYHSRRQRIKYMAHAMVKHKTRNGERECWRVPSKEMAGQSHVAIREKSEAY